MMLLMVKLFDLIEALLDHFVNVQGTMFWQNDVDQWQGSIASTLTEKGNETVGALSTVVHIGSVFLAQLMLFLVYPFYNISAYVSSINP